MWRCVVLIRSKMRPIVLFWGNFYFDVCFWSAFLTCLALDILNFSLLQPDNTRWRLTHNYSPVRNACLKMNLWLHELNANFFTLIFHVSFWRSFKWEIVAAHLVHLSAIIIRGAPYQLVIISFRDQIILHEVWDVRANS